MVSDILVFWVLDKVSNILGIFSLVKLHDLTKRGFSYSQLKLADFGHFQFS